MSNSIPESATLHSLSHGQRALWFMQQLQPEGAAYNFVHAARILTELDVSAFRQACQKLVDRHPALRTTFPASAGEPVQRVHDRMEVCFQVEEAADWSEAYLNDRLAEEIYRPFDLARGPLMRMFLFTRSTASGREHIVLLAMHHIVTDLWSLAVIMSELGELYAAEKAGVPASLNSPPTLYTDYVRQQAEALNGTEGERLWAYWQKRLAGAPSVLNLFTDRPRPPVLTDRGAASTLRFGAELTRGLKALARAQGATLYMTLLAAFQVLLHRYTGQEDILVASPFAGRGREAAGLVGYFVNPLVLRADLSANPTFSAFLGQVRQTALEAFAHSAYPLPLLIERLQPVRDPSRPPLVQAVFAWQQTTSLVNSQAMTSFALGERNGGRLELGKLQFESMALEHRAVPFELMLLMADAGEELVATVEYNTDLFDAAAMARMLEHYQTLLEAIVANPKRCISELAVLTAAEEKRLLVEWNATAAAYSSEQCVHTIGQLFESQVERTPEAPAVTFEGRQLSYRELNERANQLAHYLRKLGVGPEVLVGICVERSLEMIIGVLGVLKAGGAYVPIDPTYPQERLAFMLHDSQAGVLLTQARLLAGLPPHQAEVAQVLCLDADWPAISQERKANPESQAAADNLAYVIYTSGSTGKPKGTLLHHRGLCNFAFAYSKGMGIEVKSRFLQFASFSFDASVAETFTTLLSGATLCLASRETLLSGSSLIRLLREEEITAAILPPSMLKLLPAEGLPELRTVISAGEACSSSVVARWAPGRRFFNAYGPTEATIGPTFGLVNEVPPAGREEARNIPIGRPIANTQIYLLDRHQQPAPAGVPGEIYVGGVGVARGYLNRPELTAEKFIPDPFSREPGARLYRTGDRARYLPDANIEYLERIDRQVKLRGYRIELEEIDAQLEQHPAVRQAVVLAREDKAGNQRLVAYLVPQESRRLELWPSVAEYFIYDDLLYYAMTHDERRNRSYQVAINRAVKDKVVLDIGTGQDAILARFCVEAGARRVYAIELLAESFRKAKACIRQFGLEDRIILIQGDATQVQLPEKADVCVSEIVGAIGGTEGASLILNNAWRHLKDGGTMIPARSLTHIAAVNLPDAQFLAQPGFTKLTAGYVEKIFAQVGHRFDLRLCFKGLRPSDLISEAGVFEDLDFSGPTSPEYQRDLTLRITKDGRMDGFLAWLQLHTTPGEVIDILEQEHCWLPVYFPVFYPGIEVSKGEVLRARVTATLCENKLNPDYRVSGQLIRANGESVGFDYTSYHYKPAYKQTPFYRSLFAPERDRPERDREDAIKVISHQPVNIKSQDLRAYLKDRLPEYMIPAAFVTLEALPLTPNGKVDRQALPAPSAERSDSGSTYVQPQTQLEQTIAAVWQEVLGVEQVGIQDNFFDLGGHSLLLAKAQARLQEITGKEIQIVEMFRSPTVSTLAEYLSQEHDGRTSFQESRNRAVNQREAMNLG